MSEENELAKMQKEIEALKQENAELKKADDLKDIKAKYEELIKSKDDEINQLAETNAELQEQNEQNKSELNRSIEKELEATESYKEVLATVKELKTEQANTMVDSYINKGVILPAQRDAAVKLALSDADTFNSLYKDQPPIIQVNKEKHSIPSDKLKALQKYYNR